MKAGAEVHFLAGQLFTLGVAALAVGPRMPFDNPDTLSIGGRLSFPFRRGLLGLVVLGIVRVIVCHILFPDLSSSLLDAILGTIHVVGQSFLCLTTAYLLQVQLSTVINISPGRSLISLLVAVIVLTILAFVLAHTIHPNYYCLEHVAEALSCYGVLQTLHTYSSVTAPNSNGRGPFLTQLVRLTEYWFLITSVLAFLGEASQGFLLTKFHHEDEDHPIVVLLEAFRQNQDSGVDDWTRLLIHSIFLNSLDELQHFTSGGQAAQQQNSSSSENSSVAEENQLAVSKPLRSRASQSKQSV
uniref:Uncharacterized protein n=1 Tax=Attheya septentrionalis TaxID=420275 RepID=A0A7S2UNU4_9STRA|mmetsp:Transcript_6348/g.11309  ORF Transcript_6348/g.11309 Transcript_6348/m.11309 type:complete len:299 (+) Transcript_6348:475-1371(+)